MTPFYRIEASSKVARSHRTTWAILKRQHKIVDSLPDRQAAEQLLAWIRRPGTSEETAAFLALISGRRRSVSTSSQQNPRARYKLRQLLSECGGRVPHSAELAAWEAMHPVGRVGVNHHAYPPHRAQLVLYLDFDGVLHPTHASGDGLFCWRNILVNLLAPYPEIAIRVASDWRCSHSDAELRMLLGPLGGERFIGITEIYDESSRTNESLADVDANGFGNWLVLDDAPDIHSGHAGGRLEFIPCESSLGLSDMAVQTALASALAKKFGA